MPDPCGCPGDVWLAIPQSRPQRSAHFDRDCTSTSLRMRVTTNLMVLAAACVALSSSVNAVDTNSITFGNTDLSTEGNAGVVASDADTGKTPCPSLPQATSAADSTTVDTTTTDAPAATDAPVATDATAAIETPAATEAIVATEAPAATEAAVATEAPAATTSAKTPCPSLPQPSLSSSASGESSTSKSGKSPCPSLQTASTSSDGSVSVPCPSLKTKTAAPCPSLSTASKSSDDDAASGSTSGAIEVAISSLAVAAVTASTVFLL